MVGNGSGLDVKKHLLGGQHVLFRNARDEDNFFEYNLTRHSLKTWLKKKPKKKSIKNFTLFKIYK